MKNTIVITGATGSIGGATAIELIKQGKNDLILAGRSREKLEALKKELLMLNHAAEIEIEELDLSDIASAKMAAARIKSRTDKLSALINIAAVYKGKKAATKDGLETMFATNHLGVFILTTGLLDVLKNVPGSRVVTVTAPSTTKLNFDDLQWQKKYSAFTAFGASKMANLLFTYALARKFEHSTSAAIAFHPGLVKSALMNDMPGFLNGLLQMLSAKPQETAVALAKLATDDSIKNANGKFFNKKLKEIKSSAYSHDAQVQDKLWQVSEELIKSA